MAEYFDCLDARLNVDHRTQTERPFASVNTTMPYLVLPVTVEQGDMKALMCNLTVPVRHLMYVQNGGVGSMTAFLDRVQAAFAFTARLKVHRMPHNYGYAVALNVAMRDALALPFDEVPFFMMANNDVRMPVGMLEDGLPQMYERSLAGRARVAELEAEVATEPNEHTPQRFRAVPLRSTDDRHVLVTSRLLPDRIRYMSKDQRRAAFAEYYGALYVDKTDQTAFWGVTRLAMEVTGFFDENCYPAYYEDTDYLRRMWLMGFKIFQVAGWERSPMHHINNGAILGVRPFEAAPELQDVYPFILGSTYVIHRQFAAAYILLKYDLQGVSWPDPGRREPFMRDQLPLDVFVLNEQRNAAISELQRVAVLLEGTPNLKLEWNVRSAGEWLARHNASLNIALGSYVGNGLTYYRDGNALRLLPSLGSNNIALKVLQSKATTTTTITAEPETREPLYFDENLARAGEMPISMAEYFDCLDARLNVDHRTQTERPFASVNTTMPYLVLPVTVEQGDMKALMCNLTVPVRHLMYVQNGGVGSMTAFLDRVQAAFAFTARLKVHRMPHNYGYAVALNVAMRDALALPFDEVPFFMMANNDVRMPVGMLEDGLPQMYERSLAGRARVAELEAEVATEPNEHTPQRFRAVPLRSTDDRHVLVTSRLLPDRIRYMSKDQRRAAFAEYYGALYVDKTDQTAFWGVTRLAMEVTGFFDENCYPAYYEDTDYLRRMWLLGFKIFQVAGWERSPMHHINNGAILGVRPFEAAPELQDVYPFILGSTYVIRLFLSGAYTQKKYGILNGVWPDKESKEPFERDRLPLDAFVVDTHRNAAIAELQRLSVRFHGAVDPGVALGARTPLLLLKQKNEFLFHKIHDLTLDGALYYRDGNELRLPPSVP